MQAIAVNKKTKKEREPKLDDLYEEYFQAVERYKSGEISAKEASDSVLRSFKSIVQQPEEEKSFLKKLFRW